MGALYYEAFTHGVTQQMKCHISSVLHRTLKNSFAMASMFEGQGGLVQSYQHCNCALLPSQTANKKARILPFRPAIPKRSSKHSNPRARGNITCATVDDEPGDWAPIDIDALSRQVRCSYKTTQRPGLIPATASTAHLSHFCALQLSQEADKLRKELSEQDNSSSQSDRPKEGADRLQEREAAAIERFREGAERLQDQESAALDPQQSPFGYEVRNPPMQHIS